MGHNGGLAKLHYTSRQAQEALRLQYGIKLVGVFIDAGAVALGSRCAGLALL